MKPSPRTVEVLVLISRGLTESQMLARKPYLSRDDIVRAASEALDALIAADGSEEDEARPDETPPRTGKWTELQERVREQYPRAWDPWTAAEDEQLVELWKSETSTKQCAEFLGRRPSAIQSRLKKLKLLD